MRSARLLPLLAFVGLLLPVGAQETPAAPDSLVHSFPPTLYFSASPERLVETAGNRTACLVLQTPTQTPVTKTFRVDPMPFNVSWTALFDTTVILEITSAGADQTPAASSGFSLEVKVAGTTIADRKEFAPGSGSNTPPPSMTFSLRGNMNVTGAANAPYQLQVTLTPTAQTGIIQSVAVACGTGSKVEGLKLLRGKVGERDTDGDGLPESEDPDDDNDGFSDEQEAGIQCALPAATYDFSKDGDLQPGAHDGDTDGGSDEDECSRGFDPTTQLSKIPPPKPFPWGLLILGFIVLALLAGLYFFITVFGKALTLAVVSSSELYLKPGETGKYQIEATSVRKKGDPITYQLVALDLPEGWDAKLQPDHVTLENVGTGRERAPIVLAVESPEHQDPESAVVKVKAIPLNKAGRKDTTKLPANVKTITSINVPPGAKVPVKRGAPVKMRTEKELAKGAQEPAGHAEKDRPVIDIEGIGETYAKKLDRIGIKTIHDLEAANADEVAKKIGAPAKTVRQWQAMAQLIDLAGVGPQYAELLARAGIGSIGDLAAADAGELTKKIEELNAEREVPIQGGPAGAKMVKKWIKAAKKQPERLAVAAEAAPAAKPPKGKKGAPEPGPTPAVEAPAKPQIQVGGLAHEPPVFKQGESVKSSVTVTNKGNAAQTIKLSLFVNEGLADAQTVTVKPGKSKDIRFKWTAQERNKLNIRGELVGG